MTTKMIDVYVDCGTFPATPHAIAVSNEMRCLLERLKIPCRVYTGCMMGNNLVSRGGYCPKKKLVVENVGTGKYVTKDDIANVVGMPGASGTEALAATFHSRETAQAFANMLGSLNRGFTYAPVEVEDAS